MEKLVKKRRVPALDFRRHRLQDALKQLANMTGLDIRAGSGALGPTERESLNIKTVSEMSLASMLMYVAQDAGLCFGVMPGYVIVDTCENLEKIGCTPQVLGNWDEKEIQWIEQMEQKIHRIRVNAMEFRDADIASVLEALSGLTGVNILAERNVVARGERQGTLTVSFGADKELSFYKMFRQLYKATGLRCEIHPYALFVTFAPKPD